jgi:hypothetical protein
MAVVAEAPVQPFEHLVLDFLAYLEFERGLSRNTLEAYRSDLLQFNAWLERTGDDPLALGHSELAAFAAELAGAVSPASVQRKVACLRSFYRHLRRSGTIEHDPTVHLKAPRQSRKLPQVLSRDEVASLLAQPTGMEPTALRDRALLELMYACGLRASRPPSSRSPTSTSRWASCARGARAPRSGSYRWAAPRRGRSRATSARAGRVCSVTASPSPGSSSTTAAVGSRVRASTRSSSATRDRPGSRAG